jgi:hypothetical protein
MGRIGGTAQLPKRDQMGPVPQLTAEKAPNEPDHDSWNTRVNTGTTALPSFCPTSAVDRSATGKLQEFTSRLQYMLRDKGNQLRYKSHWNGSAYERKRREVAGAFSQGSRSIEKETQNLIRSPPFLPTAPLHRPSTRRYFRIVNVPRRAGPVSGAPPCFVLLLQCGHESQV